MHELSIASAVLDVALRSASGRRVSAVRLRAGALRQVVPDSVQFYWEFVARETLCEGSELDVVEVPAVLACRDCGSESELELPIFRCAQCAGADVAVVCGEELEVEYVEVVDAGDALTALTALTANQGRLHAQNEGEGGRRRARCEQHDRPREP